MGTNWKSLLRRVLPPILVDLLRGPPPLQFVGRYASWAAARAASAGYDDPSIHDVVLDAARRVRSGQAAFERDGVAFSQPDYVWPVTAALLCEAVKHRGRLHVLDFGGSLGSFYFQHRALLQGLNVRWAIVEQPAFAATGNREFADDVLSFHATLEAAVRAAPPDVVLFSSVLNYLEEPHAILAAVLAQRPGAVVIDRTAVTAEPADWLTVQHAPRHVYRASYPAWILSRAKLFDHFAADYQKVAEFECAERPVSGAEFRGFYFARPGEPGED